MRNKILISLLLLLSSVFTLLNTQLKTKKISDLTFKNTEALAYGGESGGYFDNHQEMPDRKTPCTINGKIPGIWIGCVSGNHTCFSGCQEEKKK